VGETCDTRKSDKGENRNNVRLRSDKSPRYPALHKWEVAELGKKGKLAKKRKELSPRGKLNSG